MVIEKATTSLGDQEFPVPPGFVSLASFTLKKVIGNDEASKSKAVGNAGEAQPSSMDSSPAMEDKSSVLHNQRGCNGNGSKPEHDMHVPLRACLPKGVIRGCSKCANCQKVISRWYPEESRRPVLEEAPVFYPTEEEFKDTLKYIASIRPKTEDFGVCRIAPPPSWKLPRLPKEKSVWERSTFETNIQRVDELNKLISKRKLSCTHEEITLKRRKLPQSSKEHQSSNECNDDGNKPPCPDESFKSESGPKFTLKDFKEYTDDFKSQYFCGKEKVASSSVSSIRNQERREPSVENVEGEYWRIIENPSEEIEVLCGINISSREFGSSFPVDSSSSQMPEYLEYTGSDWNLNNTPVLPGSLLLFESSNTSTASVPQLFMGMCFSSLCWITQLPPSVLKAEGIPLFRCVQSPGEFVLTFPGAYHSEFDTGSIVLRELILLLSTGAAMVAVRAKWELSVMSKLLESMQWIDISGKDGILTKLLKLRIRKEVMRREYLCSSFRSRRIDDGFDITAKRECSICLFDLHFSAIGCSCTLGKYACHLCSCASDTKYLLVRHEIDELNVLVKSFGR